MVAERFGAWARAAIAKQEDPQSLKILEDRIASLAISYIDTFTISRGDDWIDVTSLPKRIKSVAMLVTRKTVIDTVGDKRNFGRLAKQVGVEGVVVPRTFESAEEAVAALTGPTKSSRSDMAFVKSSTGSASKEVEPVTTDDLVRFLEARGGLKRGELIQEGVDGLALHDGRKLVIRSFFIVHGGALYVSHHAVANVYGQKFDSSSSSREVHVEFEGPNTIIEDLNLVVGQIENAKWIAAIIAAAKLVGPMFERIVAESANNNLMYHMFGVDVLPKASGTVMFCECNIFPNLGISGASKVGFVLSVLRLIYGVVKGDGEVDEEMTKVWSIPLEINPSVQTSPSVQTRDIPQRTEL
jgi:hypothetical protein